MQILFNYYKELFFENRRWLTWSMRWFLVAVGLGVAGFFFQPDLLDSILKIFEDKFGPDPGISMNLVKAIFAQNLMASLFSLLGGVVLGLSSALALALNGFLIGFIVAALVAAFGPDPAAGLGFLFGGLVPHGILELPAFILAAAFGLRLGLEWLKKDSAGKRWQVWKTSLMQAISILPLIILLLALAALIEVFVSGAIVNKI